MDIKYYGPLCSINQKFVGRSYHLSKKYREAKKYLHDHAYIALREQRLPCKTSKVKMSINMRYPRKGTDIDSSLKFVLDALNGICYLDDSQIFELEVTKEYVKKDMQGCDISIISV